MELVYLWVEDYKNIHKQGFNFSPRFSCEYDGEKLTICDKKDKLAPKCKDNNYIENFFGNNINVTAIVGKNGSGKSSVLKLILYLIFCKNYKKEDKYKVGTLVYILQQFANKELFLLFHNGKEFKKIVFSNFIKHLKGIEFGDSTTITRNMTGSQPKKNEILQDILELTQEELKFFTFYLNYMIDTLYDGFHDNWVNEIYHKQDNYETPLLIQPNKHDANSLNDVVNLFMIDFVNKQRLLLLYKDIGKNKKITNFFNANYLKIKNDFIDHFRVDMSNSDETKLTIIKKIANKLNHLLYIKQKEYKLDNKKIPVAFKKIEDDKDYEYMNLLYLVFKILTVDKILFNEVEYNELEKYILSCIEKNELPKKDYLSDYNFVNIIKVENDDYRIKKILISIEFHKKKIYENKYFMSLLNDEKVSISKIKDILEYLPVWIDVVFYEDNKSFESLSSGEKSLFRIIIDIVYQIQKIKIHYSSINIMLDEAELGLHPQWQKEYLKNILESISLYVDGNFTVNLLFSTHSPFILSDIPKQNIIFLDKDEKGNCKVVDGLKEKKQTFGANIHTLLSDSFFMEDGLMGEFAKGKIEEVINYLNDDKESLIKDNEEAQKLINIIGEPIIKNQLQRMLDSQRLVKIDKIDLIEKQIKMLQDELKKVQK